MPLFNEWLTTGVPPDFTLGIIVLLFKKGDKEGMSNYNPISLLNSDLKIFTRVISNRIHQIVDKKIPFNLFAFIKGRSLYQCVAEGQSLLHHAKGLDKACLIFPDQKK